MEGGDDPKGKRKMLSKQVSRQGRGRNTSSSGAAPRVEDRDAHQRYIEEEGLNQQIGYTIPSYGCPGTPLHLTEYDNSYMRASHDEFNFRPPDDRVAHPIIDYSKSWKGTEEAREMNPYANPKNFGIDYRFWDVFHSNFYATAILSTMRSKIVKMQYIDFNEIQDKGQPEFTNVIRTCDKFEISDIMSFRYDWNEEILAQFHATYFWNREADEIHWMTDGHHYCIDFVTFYRILGFGQEHRTYTRIHDENRAEISDIRYMWRDPRVADGMRSGLESFYYIMNNLIRNTLNPKDGAASDLNGYVRNVLARFHPGGDKFNVPRFLWVELSFAMDDGRRGLPYAPYLMFMIERITGVIFPKDGVHSVYKIEKTHASAAPQRAREHYSHDDIPEGSRSRSSRRKSSWKKKISSWMKAVFTTCSYAATTAYETRLENREAHRQARDRVGLPPLPPIESPPRFDLSGLTDTGSDEEDQQEQQEDSWEHETLRGYQQRQRQTQDPKRSARFTATAHRQGRAHIDSNSDDDDGGATEGRDVDWEGIQEDSD